MLHPVLDGGFFVGESVLSNHRGLHQLVCDGANELLWRLNAHRTEHSRVVCIFISSDHAHTGAFVAIEMTVLASRKRRVKPRVAEGA